jgi:HCOMODA/2-hydroxy-3-carboxy-muconic semialdehyde decarboxylase
MLSPEVPVYDDYDFTSPGTTGMLVTTKEQGDRLARVLGKSRAVLMRGHGCTVVGPDLPYVLNAVIEFRTNMIVELAAMQIGTPKSISEEEAKVNTTSRSAATVPAISAAARLWSSLLVRAKKAMPDLQ